MIQSPEVIDRTDDGIVTLHSRVVFDYPISGQELYFRLGSISYNIRSGTCDIDFDFSSIAPQKPAAWVWDTPILPHHLHDIKLELDGFENTWDNLISSIGIIDGKLHIQQQQAPLSRANRDWAWFSLADLKGEDVFPYDDPQWPLTILSYKIDENGNYRNYHDDAIAGINPELPHLPLFREDIYEIDLNHLSQYKIVARYNAENWIDLNWEVSFEVDIPTEGVELVADGLNIELERSRTILREVRITPYNILISADYIQVLPVSPNPKIVINTTSGPVSPIVGGSMMFSNRFDDCTFILLIFCLFSFSPPVPAANFRFQDR